MIFEERKTWTQDQQKSMDSNKITTFTIVTPRTLFDEKTVEESVDTQQAGSDSSEEQTARPHSQSGAQESKFKSLGSCDSEPVNFRSLTDIYNETKEVEIDDELLPMGIDKPRNIKKQQMSETRGRPWYVK